MELRSKKVVTALVAVAGMAAIGITTVLADAGVTTTFTLNVTGPTLGLTVTTPQVAWDLNTIGQPSSTYVPVSIYNTGNSEGTITAQLGTAPGNLTYVGYTPKSPGQLWIEASQNPSGWSTSGLAVPPAILTAANTSSIGTLPADATGDERLTFTLGPNTPSGAYKVPVTWQIS